MTQAPVFNFTKNSVTLNEEEFQAAAAKEESGGNFLDVGQYSVKIKEAKFHINKDTDSMFCAKDPTWFNVVITLESDGKEKLFWLQVPTSKLQFSTSSGKNELFAFRKFREFMDALGVTVLADVDELSKIVPKYFTDPSVIEGKAMKIEIQYTKPHLKRTDGGKFIICNRDGSPHKLFDKEFDSRDDAVADAAIEGNLTLQSFPEIVKFEPEDEPKTSKTTPKKKAKPKKKAAPEPVEDDDSPEIVEDVDAEDGDWE